MKSAIDLNRVLVFLISTTLLVSFSACGGSSLDKKLAEAQSALSTQRYSDAHRILAETITSHPESADTFTLFGRAALGAQDISKATAAFQKAVALDPDQTDARLLLARILNAAGDTLRAQAQVDAVLSTAPQHTQALLPKALILQQARDYHAAETLLGEMLDDCAASAPEAFLLMSNVQLLQRKGREALDTLAKGTARYPDRKDLKHRHAQLLIRGGQHPAAINIYRSLVEAHPEDDQIRLNLAGLYWNTDEPEKAEEALTPMLDKADRGRQERLELARFFIRHGSVERAEAELRQGLVATPGDVQLRIQLADLFLRQKQFATALAVVDEGLGLKADLLLSDSQALSNAKARVLLVSGKASEALVVVDGVLAEASKQAGALATKGQILIKQGRGNAAVSIFRDILQRQPRDLNGYLHLAEAYAATGDVDLSVKALRDGLRLAPQSALLRKALAKAHTALKDNSRAEREYNEVRIKAPRQPVGYLRLTRLHLKQGIPDEAVRVLAEGYRRNPSRAELLEPLVNLLIQQERFPDAEKLCQDRIDGLPEKAARHLAISHFLFGRVLKAQKNYLQAEKAFARAAELAAQWSPPQKQLVALEIAQGRKKAARKHLAELIEKFPRERGLHLSLGQLYREAKQTDEAIAVYENAIAAIPDFWQAEEQQARILLDRKKGKGDIQKAETLLTDALKRHPRTVSLIDALADTYYRKGDFGQAAEIYTKLHHTAPQDARINYRLALSLNNSGEPGKAVSHLKKALASKTAFSAREKATALLKRLEKKS